MLTREELAAREGLGYTRDQFGMRMPQDTRPLRKRVVDQFVAIDVPNPRPCRSVVEHWMWYVEGAELAAHTTRHYALPSFVKRARPFKLTARLRLRNGGCTHLRFLNSVRSDSLLTLR